jgi:hypothetical protein
MQKSQHKSQQKSQQKSQHKSQQTGRMAQAGQRQRRTETEARIGWRPHAYKQKHSAAHTCTELCNFLSCS